MNKFGFPVKDITISSIFYKIKKFFQWPVFLGVPLTWSTALKFDSILKRHIVGELF